MTNIETITHHLKGQLIEHNHHRFAIKNIEWALGYPSGRLNVSADIIYQNQNVSMTQKAGLPKTGNPVQNIYINSEIIAFS